MNTGTKCPWEVTSEKVEAVIEKIVEVCRPMKIILFGSYVRGETDANSDLDILVVAQGEVENPRRESVRIRRVLRDIFMPMDILVVSRSNWEALKDVPGLVYREASMNGKVAYESR